MLDPKSLTPGELDGAARTAFMHGACAALAIALHDATGWPLAMVTDAWNVEGGVAGGGSALHWIVRHPSGRFVDVGGFHSEADLVDEFEPHADEEGAAIGTASRDDAVEWYVEAQGEPIPLRLAATFVAPLLAYLGEGTGRSTTDQQR
jgi:hypothetical protein